MTTRMLESRGPRYHVSTLAPRLASLTKPKLWDELWDRRSRGFQPKPKSAIVRMTLPPPSAARSLLLILAKASARLMAALPMQAQHGGVA